MTAIKERLATQQPGTRRLLALICLSLFLFLQAAAASNSLHQVFHLDAGDAGHTCAVTLLAHGQLDAPVFAAGLAVFVAAVLFLLPVPKSVRIASLDCRLSPSRAPPRF